MSCSAQAHITTAGARDEFVDALLNPNMGGSGGDNDNNDAVERILSCDTTLSLFLFS
jgi:hypothetical protein